MPPFASTHKEHIQIGYSFVYTPGVLEHIIGHVLRNQGTRMEQVLFFCTCRVEYHANEIVSLDCDNSSIFKPE